MTDLTKRLPVEVLAAILGHASVPDILRSMQVNRAFSKVVRSSSLIDHKIDLYAAGFEYNPAAGIDLAESGKALSQYLSNLYQLCPAEGWSAKNLRVEDKTDHIKTSGGVTAIVNKSVRLFVVGSSSRRIPYKEWEIPLPPIELENYGFYPGADIIAFVELQETFDMQLVVHLRTLSSGGSHPAARCPTISYSRKGVFVTDVPSVSISSSRLAVLMLIDDGACMVICDWKSSQVLFALENERYHAAEFIDDYRLLVNLGSSEDVLACIMLMDTEKDVGGAPVQTSFHLPACFEYTSLLFERGVHEPSPAECLAPFHQDPTQRIAVLSVPASCYLFFPVEALSRLAKGREECEIEWDEWKTHVVIPSLSQTKTVTFCVSGCRAFCITPSRYWGGTVEVYDFSMEGRVEHLSEEVNKSLGGIKYMESTGKNASLPFHIDDLFDMGSGHGSIVFIRVPNDLTEDEDEGGCIRRIWAF